MQVEALKGYRVIDVACGSGDAQTLCITDDDSAWSWGDGDYGKLGEEFTHILDEENMTNYHLAYSEALDTFNISESCVSVTSLGDKDQRVLSYFFTL